jgi:hypothetical protein
MNYNSLVIYQDLTEGCRYPFRIAETFASVDGGYRTRMTHKCFSTLEEANDFVREFKEGFV